MYSKTQAQLDALIEVLGIIIKTSEKKKTISDSLIHLSNSGPSSLLPPEYRAEYINTVNKLIEF